MFCFSINNIENEICFKFDIEYFRIAMNHCLNEYYVQRNPVLNRKGIVERGKKYVTCN